MSLFNKLSQVAIDFACFRANKECSKLDQLLLLLTSVTLECPRYKHVVLWDNLNGVSLLRLSAHEIHACGLSLLSVCSKHVLHAGVWSGSVTSLGNWICWVQTMIDFPLSLYMLLWTYWVSDSLKYSVALLLLDSYVWISLWSCLEVLSYYLSYNFYCCTFILIIL